MEKCVLSLIAHLEAQFTAPTVRTIREYGGELNDAHKLTAAQPALFVLYPDGNPMAGEVRHQVAIIIITRNTVLDRTANKAANLTLASSVCDYLRTNFTFRPHDGSSGSYVIQRDEVSFGTLSNDGQFCVHALHLPILVFPK